MIRLIFDAYLLLLRIELTMAIGGLPVLHRDIRKQSVAAAAYRTSRSPDVICRAADWACVLYPKQVLCLQRSAAATILLRLHGIRAEMLIGAQLLPFRSHAWVEVDGTVVNDKPYMRQIYQVLDHC